MKLLAMAAASAAIFVASAASAAPVPILGTANIYQLAGSTDGTAPYSTTVAGGSTITFSATGAISFNGGGNINDADGIGSASSINVSSLGDFSGFSAPHAGSLVGVFFNPRVALLNTPATLDFNTIGTNFSTLSPLLDQVFFIGDGLTGDGTGTVQSFIAPRAATMLYLGFADAGGYNGSPGSYGDNTGALSVTVNAPSAVGAVPEPASWAMVILGMGAVGFTMRRRVRASEVKFDAKIKRIADGAAV